MKNAVLASLLVASGLSVTLACAKASSSDRPAPNVPVTRMPESAGGDTAEAEREAGDAIAAYRQRRDDCRAGAHGVDCALPPPDPCGPPQRPLAASLLGVQPGLFGKTFHDGKRCYVASEAEPGPCASGYACHEWTTLAACEAALALCAANP